MFWQITVITVWTPQFSALCWHIRLLSQLDKGCHVLDKMQACSFCDTLCMVYLYTRMLIWLVCDDECVLTGGRSGAGFIKVAVVSSWWMLRARCHLGKLIRLYHLSKRRWQTQPWTGHTLTDAKQRSVSQCVQVGRSDISLTTIH